MWSNESNSFSMSIELKNLPIFLAILITSDVICFLYYLLSPAFSSMSNTNIERLIDVHTVSHFMRNKAKKVKKTVWSRLRQYFFIYNFKNRIF